jgi:hypothetical protein
MSLSNGPAGHSAETPSGHDGDPSPFAPKWARDGGMRPRKVVPLRIPSAPQLVPAVTAPSAPAPSVSGPDLLAQDAVLKRLLENAPPDPQPPAVQPVRDPVGLALGMVARLIVAASAAAGIAMLLFGVVPLPFRTTPPAMVEATPAGAIAQPTAAAAQPVASPDTERVAKSEQRLGDDQAADALPAPPARVATTSVHAPAPVPAPAPLVLEAGEIELLIRRGEEFLAQGDIAAARLILGRAADAHDARAAFSLAQTFDPDVLKRLRVLGFKPDLGQARALYEKAAGYGSAEAAGRLEALPGR